METSTNSSLDHFEDLKVNDELRQNFILLHLQLLQVHQRLCIDSGACNDSRLPVVQARNLGRTCTIPKVK
jgi:hypothetical protein